MNQQQRILDIQAMVTAAAPLAEVVELREFDETSWVLALSDDLLVSVDHDEARDVLVMTARLGSPQPGQEAELFGLLLRVATQWRDTGGLRMGLDPVDGEVRQIADLPLAALTPESLAAALRDFGQTASAWASVVASAPPAAIGDDHLIRI